MCKKIVITVLFIKLLWSRQRRDFSVLELSFHQPVCLPRILEALYCSILIPERQTGIGGQVNAKR